MVNENFDNFPSDKDSYIDYYGLQKFYDTILVSNKDEEFIDKVKMIIETSLVKRLKFVNKFKISFIFLTR